MKLLSRTHVSLYTVPDKGVIVAFTYEEQFAACKKEFLYEDDKIVKAYGGNKNFCDKACGSMIPVYTAGQSFHCVMRQ